MKRQANAIAALAVCCLVAAGCGSDGLETAEVTGTVSLDGEPLSHGTVTFTPEKGRAATGAIQSDGTFTLSTYKNGDGAVVGEHKIAVTCAEKIGDDQQGEPQSLDAGMFARTRTLIPAKYTDYSTSGLTFDVKDGEENEVTLELSGRDD